jgi:hypothetical protein
VPRRKRRKLHPQRVCAYCGRREAPEDDHVIARQFFPPEEVFRAGLPQVPSCGECNRAKQKVEDGPAVFLQFGHSSDASTRVVEARLRRTLAKNQRLRTALSKGLKRVWLRTEAGVLTPSMVIELSPRELRDLNRWFRFVTQGLYRFEFGENIPADHDIILFSPRNQNQYGALRYLIDADSHKQVRSVAQGEFEYLFTRNVVEELSGWLYRFKSVDIFAVTLGPNVSGDTRRVLASAQWDPADSEPSPTNNDSAGILNRTFGS